MTCARARSSSRSPPPASGNRTSTTCRLSRRLPITGSSKHQRILILDFGAQYTKLIDGIEDFRTPEGHGMLKVWMSHGDKVVHLPAGFKLMASTDACPIAGIADESRRYYGVQFHPEVTHTRQGAKILQRFVRDICGCRGDWTMPASGTEAAAKIKA